ncbi:MAG: hypothetical protein UU24_C0003G0015 [Candidatus Nomurabacteria bacterium GW2011_GWA2_40_9]|uniref:Uncharacterized protein n=1 Tax=Candidatus Nomurabacteria bacterium GW2011_GWA2_40_9 TaxID=1618734 RepID=A0A0G0W690_9BACT|nr:MAG: hypothetical protein UU24_C0003G0015 [Candidatus Nomurabacteria bacterium GW2011_GWA2_40_9]
MLPKINRISTKQVEQIFKSGIFVNSEHISFKFILSNSNCPQISFIVPKTVSKSAVKRNLLRRRGYNAIQSHIHDFPLGIVGVFIFKKYQDDIQTLSNEIQTTLKKIQY